MKIGQVYRQGDVFMRRVAELPSGALPVDRDDRGRIVLAYGEVTGHAHAIYADGAAEYVVREAEAIVARYIVTTADVAVEHEEHTAHVIPAGAVVEVIQQVEETDDGVRNVAD